MKHPSYMVLTSVDVIPPGTRWSIAVIGSNNKRVTVFKILGIKKGGLSIYITYRMMKIKCTLHEISNCEFPN